jgi:uncharacterized membrane protein
MKYSKAFLFLCLVIKGTDLHDITNVVYLSLAIKTVYLSLAIKTVYLRLAMKEVYLRLVIKAVNCERNVSVAKLFCQYTEKKLFRSVPPP